MPQRAKRTVQTAKTQKKLITVIKIIINRPNNSNIRRTNASTSINYRIHIHIGITITINVNFGASRANFNITQKY